MLPLAACSHAKSPTCRPANPATLALHTPVPGELVPEFGLQAGGRQHFLVDMEAGPCPPGERCSMDGRPQATPFPGLVMGPLLGKGSYGRVYQGIFKGDVAAVKVRHRGMLCLQGAWHQA